MESVSIRGVTNSTRVKVDTLSESLRMIDVFHSEVHEGKGFGISHFFSAVADKTTAQMLVRAHGVTPHIEISVGAGGDAYVLFMQGLTASGAGTTKSAPVNRNRTSSNTSGVSVFHTPVVTTYSGTTLISNYIPGGARNSAGGGSMGERNEWVLKNGTTYVIAVRNIAGSTKNIAIQTSWYEL